MLKTKQAQLSFRFLEGNINRKPLKNYRNSAGKFTWKTFLLFLLSLRFCSKVVETNERAARASTKLVKKKKAQRVSECAPSYHLLPLHRLVLNRIEKGCKGGEKKRIKAALQY